VISAFIIDLQSELKPDYEQMNNALLEMLLNATTGSLPPGSATSIPRWSGPDPVIVQVQCILYTTLCATLLASFFAMLGKQWLNRYRQNETRGSTADRSRVRERKLTGIETWKFPGRVYVQGLSDFYCSKRTFYGKSVTVTLLPSREWHLIVLCFDRVSAVPCQG